ncbi:MAG: Zn-ribbon domain-containing OB-fold protein [Deltaproteobacteria bacterium]|nr:Zn-ribbon domain-containing OB-fold protein [Deltaproteobacteria bacterium]
MNEQEREKWYAFEHQKYGIPIEYLKREFEKELSGQVPMDQPLEIPDKMEVIYKYSYGQQSRFFRELRENKKIYGAKCPQCSKVYCPPRAHCSLCYQPTEWVPLTGTGVIKTFTVQYISTSAFIKKVPFVCAYVQLDGTDFLLMANMEVEDVARIRVGTKVKAVFREERQGTITDFYFEPYE